LTVEQKTEKARVDDERRSVIKLTDEQKSEKARVEVERRSVTKLTARQKFEKARVEDEWRSRESSQAETIRLIDKRHSYATRSMTVANRAISNVLGLVGE